MHPWFGSEVKGTVRITAFCETCACERSVGPKILCDRQVANSSVRFN